MKKNLFLLLAVLPLFSFTLPASPTPLMTYEHGVLEVYINHRHSKTELLALKKELLEKYKVRLDFEELSYNKKGKIERIKIAVDGGNGCSGTASCRRGPVFKPKVWFIVDFNENANTAFSIGAGKRK